MISYINTETGEVDYSLREGDSIRVDTITDELCEYMEKDLKQRVAISCFTCIKGMDLSKQYGKPKKKR